MDLEDYAGKCQHFNQHPAQIWGFVLPGTGHGRSTPRWELSPAYSMCITEKMQYPNSWLRASSRWCAWVSMQLT